MKKWIYYKYCKIKSYVSWAIKLKTLNKRKIGNIRQKIKRAKNKREFIKQNGKCARCHSKENLTLDHIIPRSKGGARYDKRNWQVLCFKCNQWKKDREIKFLKGHKTNQHT